MSNEGLLSESFPRSASTASIVSLTLILQRHIISAFCSRSSLRVQFTLASCVGGPLAILRRHYCAFRRNCDENADSAPDSGSCGCRFSRYGVVAQGGRHRHNSWNCCRPERCGGAWRHG